MLPTPYFATTDATGKFVLQNLPLGTYPLVSWHELSQTKVENTVQQVQVGTDTQEVTFTLSLTTARSRPASRRGGGY